jgi:hypothetical protein
MEESKKEIEIEKTIEKRKEKIIQWIKNPSNLLLISVLVLVIAIRLYYFTLTKNQPLWWDEAEYLSTAKGFAGIIEHQYTFALNRFPGFPLLAAGFYVFGITNEIVLRFFLAFLPSILVLILLFFMVKEMYKDKRIALISVIILSLLWEHVFYSNRFHTENISLIFGFLAIFILFKTYIKKEKFLFINHKFSLVYVFLLSLLCVIFRSGNMMFLPAVFFFVILLNFYRFPSKIKISLIAFLVLTFIIFFAFIGTFAEKYPAVNLFYHYELPISWNNLNVFYGFYQSQSAYIPSIFFYAFLIGIIIFLINIFIAPEFLKRIALNSEHHEIKADILNLLLIFSVLFFFIFFLRQTSFEYRWFFVFLPGMLAFTSKGIISFSEFISSFFNSKTLSIFVILVLLILGSYYQFNHTDSLIKGKLTSYQEVKDSGLWIKQNSEKDDLIITASATQHAYYSERKIQDFYPNPLDKNETGFNAKLKELKPKYIVISVFEPGFTPPWALTWPQKHMESLEPVQAYFADAEQKQVILVIYKFKNYDF